MTADLCIGVVPSPAPWRAELAAHVGNHVAGVVVRVLAEPRVAFDDHLDVVVIDDVVRFFSADELDALRRRGVGLAGVYDPSGRTGRGRDALLRAGVTTLLAATASSDELLAELEALARARPSLETESEPGAGPQPSPAVATDEVTAVVGGSDSPGRTEVAIAVAHSLGERGEPVLVVDLDTANPGVARRLGLGLTPTLADAVAAVGAGDPLATALAVPLDGSTDRLGFDVVGGLAPRAGADAMGDGELAPLLEVAAVDWRHVVVDCASSWSAPATRAALECAGRVVAVCSASPCGVLRCLDFLAEGAPHVGERTLNVVFNRAPRDTYRRRELEGALRAHLPAALVAGVWFLPDDDAVRTAAWEGAVVGRGRFATAAADLATHLVSARARPPDGAAQRREAAA